MSILVVESGRREEQVDVASKTVGLESRDIVEGDIGSWCWCQALCTVRCTCCGDPDCSHSFTLSDTKKRSLWSNIMWCENCLICYMEIPSFIIKSISLIETIQARGRILRIPASCYIIMALLASKLVIMLPNNSRCSSVFYSDTDIQQPLPDSNRITTICTLEATISPSLQAQKC